jgi:hypothetical protein
MTIEIQVGGNVGSGGKTNSLVTTEPSACPPFRPTIRTPQAGFIAQLLATREGAPQTRARRRGTEADAQKAYYEADHPHDHDTGEVLSLKM